MNQSLREHQQPRDDCFCDCCCRCVRVADVYEPRACLDCICSCVAYERREGEQFVLPCDHLVTFSFTVVQFGLRSRRRL